MAQAYQKEFKHRLVQSTARAEHALSANVHPPTLRGDVDTNLVGIKFAATWILTVQRGIEPIRNQATQSFANSRHVKIAHQALGDRLQKAPDETTLLDCCIKRRAHLGHDIGPAAGRPRPAIFGRMAFATLKSRSLKFPVSLPPQLHKQQLCSRRFLPRPWIRFAKAILPERARKTRQIT